MALRMAGNWQQRWLGQNQSQKTAAPANELPDVSNADIARSSRAIGDVHQFQIETTSIKKWLET